MDSCTRQRCSFWGSTSADTCLNRRSHTCSAMLYLIQFLVDEPLKNFNLYVACDPSS